jgi:hypothetical protein
LAVQDEGDDTEENLVTLCIYCHNQWHEFETFSNCSFNEWLLIPSYKYFVKIWQMLQEKEKTLTTEEAICGYEDELRVHDLIGMIGRAIYPLLGNQAKEIIEKGESNER